MSVTLSASATARLLVATNSVLARTVDILDTLVRMENGEDIEMVAAPGEILAFQGALQAIVEASAGEIEAAIVHTAQCDALLAAVGERVACTCVAPKASAGARRQVAREIQPPTITGSDGKLLRKMWLKGEDFTANVFGPFIVGDTTKVGFVVRDTRDGSDEEFGRGKDFLAQALEWAAEAMDSIDPEELEALTAASLARIVDDGNQITAR